MDILEKIHTRGLVQSQSEGFFLFNDNYSNTKNTTKLLRCEILLRMSKSYT